MAKFLGETEVHQNDTPYAGYGPTDWALEYIGKYGGIDGAHHKAWVLDQVARILHGTRVDIVLAKWDDGEEEYRYSTAYPTQEYTDWVDKQRGSYDEENEEYEYDYDEGIAP
jgi:hypothetical protein